MVYVIYGNNGFIIRLCNVAYLLLAFCVHNDEIIPILNVPLAYIHTHSYIWWYDDVVVVVVDIIAAVAAPHRDHRQQQQHPQNTHTDLPGTDIQTNIIVLGMEIMANLLTMAR